ncbi:MAG: acyl-CoA dehydrogenase family protein [Deltaproteobacteria bacterium]
MSYVEKEREEWRIKAKEVAKNIVAPRAKEIDAEGEFAWDIVDAFAQRGFLSLLIPKEYGGGEVDTTSFCTIVEEIAYYCASSALLVIDQNVGLMPVVLGGGAGVEGEIPSPGGERKSAGELLSDRAGSRFRFGLHSNQGRLEQRPLCDQREEGIYYEWWGV